MVKVVTISYKSFIKIMPQLNIFSFPTQVFWFVLVFVLFYFIFKFFFLKNFSEVFKIRTKLYNLNFSKEKSKAFAFLDITIKSIF